MFRHLLETIVVSVLFIATTMIPAIADTRSEGGAPEKNGAGNAVLRGPPSARPDYAATLYEFGTNFTATGILLGVRFNMGQIVNGGNDNGDN